MVLHAASISALWCVSSVARIIKIWCAASGNNNHKRLTKYEGNTLSRCAWRVDKFDWFSSYEFLKCACNCRYSLCPNSYPYKVNIFDALSMINTYDDYLVLSGSSLLISSSLIWITKQKHKLESLEIHHYSETYSSKWSNQLILSTQRNWTYYRLLLLGCFEVNIVFKHSQNRCFNPNLAYILCCSARSYRIQGQYNSCFQLLAEFCAAKRWITMSAYVQ